MTEPSSSPAKKWSTRVARAEDAGSVERFLLSVAEFRGTLVEGEERETWKWLYLRERERSEASAMVAEREDGTLIAHYGLARLPYRVRGVNQVAGIASRLAIDDGFRKESVFMGLTLRLLKSYPASGIAFVSGLANRAGLLEFHKAFGFRAVGEVPVYAKPFRIPAIARSQLPAFLYVILWPLLHAADVLWRTVLGLRSRSLPRHLSTERITRFDGATAATSRHISESHAFFAVREHAERLNDRFADVPGRDYWIHSLLEEGRPIGYFVLRSMDMKGFRAIGIVDICFDFGRKDAARAVFGTIDRIALQQDVDLVSILANSPRLTRWLRSNLYLRSPESFQLVVHEPKGGAGPRDSRIDDWYVTWFDHDFV